MIDTIEGSPPAASKRGLTVSARPSSAESIKTRPRRARSSDPIHLVPRVIVDATYNATCDLPRPGSPARIVSFPIASRPRHTQSIFSGVTSERVQVTNSRASTVTLSLEATGGVQDAVRCTRSSRSLRLASLRKSLTSPFSGSSGNSTSRTLAASLFRSRASYRRHHYQRE